MQPSDWSIQSSMMLDSLSSSIHFISSNKCRAYIYIYVYTKKTLQIDTNAFSRAMLLGNYRAFSCDIKFQRICMEQALGYNRSNRVKYILFCRNEDRQIGIIEERKIGSQENYGFYTIVHEKPRPFQRLRWPVTVERGGAQAITGPTRFCV